VPLREQPAPWFRHYRAGTVDEARAMYGDYGQKITVHDSSIQEPFTCAIAVAQFGPIQFSRHTIADGLVVGIDRDDLYGVGISTLGHVAVELRSAEVTTCWNRAVTTDPRSGPMIIRPAPESRLDSVVIEQWALEAQVEDHLGRPVRKGIPFGAEVDLTGGSGLSLRRLIALFMDQLDDRDSMLSRPVVAEPLSHALINAILLTVDHPYSADLRLPVSGRIGRRPVRQAVEAINANPEQPHTTASLARLAGVSSRTLQEAFRRQLGQTPTRYLRQVRLACVHEELAAGMGTTVTEVANRWGFIHLGRFAAAYRAKYGVPPSATLHAGLSAKGTA
jgi:AraC-like DNA-binding protein